MLNFISWIEEYWDMNFKFSLRILSFVGGEI